MYAKILFALLIPLTVNAETVYRCTENGRTSFTAERTSGDCREMDVRPVEPNPDEVARMQRENARAEQRERQEANDAAYENLLRAQEQSARAEMRAREAERRLAEQSALQAQQPGGIYYPNGYSGYGLGIPAYPVTPVYPRGPVYQNGYYGQQYPQGHGYGYGGGVPPGQGYGGHPGYHPAPAWGQGSFAAPVPPPPPMPPGPPSLVVGKHSRHR